MLRSLILLCALTGSAAAIPTPPAEPFREYRSDVLRGKPAQPTYRITDATRVLLDGRPCDYAAIPAGARIMRLEVSEDGAIITVHFRSAD